MRSKFQLLCASLIISILGSSLSLSQTTATRRQTFRDSAAGELKAAILSSNVERVRDLIRTAGTNDCLELDEQGRTALHYALDRCLVDQAGAPAFDVLELLAGRSNCVNAADRLGRQPILELSPLSWTSRARMDSLEILIAHGVDVNARDESGATLLHQLLGTWTAGSDHWPEVLRVLIRGGLKPNLIDAEGRTALHCFFGPLGFCNSRVGDLSTKVGVAQKVLDLLISAGADVGIKNNQGTTPVGEMLNRYEPYFGGKEIVLAFAAPGMAKALRIQRAQIQNRPALIALCDKGAADPALIGRLLELGAEASGAEEGGFTALHGAAWFYNRAVAELLISHGARVNAVDQQGRTPLHELARSTYLDSAFLETDRAADALKTAELLLNNGADRRLRDKNGKTPLDFVKARPETDPDGLAILKVLRKELKPQ